MGPGVLPLSYQDGLSRPTSAAAWGCRRCGTRADLIRRARSWSAAAWGPHAAERGGQALRFASFVTLRSELAGPEHASRQLDEKDDAE